LEPLHAGAEVLEREGEAEVAEAGVVEGTDVEEDAGVGLVVERLADVLRLEADGEAVGEAARPGEAEHEVPGLDHPPGPVGIEHGGLLERLDPEADEAEPD